MFYYEVIPFQSKWDYNGERILLKYSSSQKIEFGTIVKIPFGKADIFGIVCHETNIDNLEFPLEKLKSISHTTKVILSNNYLNTLLKLHSDFKINIMSVCKSIIDKILLKIKKDGYNYKEYLKIPLGTREKNLFMGLPGTGKTTNIMKMLKIQSLKNFKSIYLVPNVSIINIIKEKMNKFGIHCDFYHSALSDKEKANVISKILKNEYTNIIGTRSLILLPFVNLDNVIVDEFHDTNLIQTGYIKSYRTTDIVDKMLENYGCNIFYVSATPTVEHYYKAMKDKNINIKYFILKNEKTPINFIYKKYLSEIEDDIVKKVKIFLEKKEKFLILVNRRGYGGQIYCKNLKCEENNQSFLLKCTKCASQSPLVYHFYKNILKCHICGNIFPITCTKCNSNKMLHVMSVGVERFAELLKNRINKKIKIFIGSSDYVGKSNITEYLNSINKYDGIIGTQIFQQGFHIKQIKNVIMVNNTKNFFDDLPEEKMKNAATIIQGAGRVFNNNGSVYIYSNKEKEEDKFISQLNLNDLYKYYLRKAELMLAPPFGNMYCLKTNYELLKLQDYRISFSVVFYDKNNDEYMITTLVDPKDMPISNFRIVGLRSLKK